MIKVKKMKDFSRNNWREYISSHINEFEVVVTGPDNYNLWWVDITSKRNRHYSEYYENTIIDVALAQAIDKLANILYQYYKTPGNL